uniref:Venom peptide n=1 Tax=Mesocestoides corti TaxID=53468 RepID=A0A5K3FZN0_MESCO
MRAVIVALLAVLLITAVSAQNIRTRVKTFLAKAEDFFDNDELGQRWAQLIDDFKVLVKDCELP